MRTAILSLVLCAIATPSVFAAEVAIPIQGFEDGGVWAAAGGDIGGTAEARIVDTVAHEGKHSLALTYDFTGTKEIGYVYARALPNVVLPGTPRSVSLWIKGDGSGRSLDARYVDAKGETFQIHLGSLDFTDWKQFTFSVTGENAFSWGTDKTGKPKLPITLASINVDKTHGRPPLKSTIYIDDVQVLTDVPEADMVQVRLGQSYPESLVPGATAQVKLEILDYLGEPGKADLRWRVRDYAGRPAGGDKQEISLGQARSRTLLLPVKLPRGGWYSVEATLTWRDHVQQASTQLCRLTPSPLAAANPASPIGINGHLPSEAEMRMMQRAGIKWARVDWLWGIAQPKPGDFNWTVFDERVAAAKRYGIELLPVLCYGVGWATTKPADAKGDVQNYMPQLDPWLAYIRAVVARYKGQIHVWEVWNEPNIGFWVSSKEDYVKLLKETYKAIKSVDPTARVTMGGLAGSPTDYLEMLYKAGCKDYTDIINIHPYQYPTIPEHGMAEQIAGIRAVMRKYGDEAKEIWATEVGYPNHQGPGGVDVRLQADYIARTYITLLASGVTRVFWYDYQNGTDVTYNEHNFGIVFVDNSPKPCLLALKTTANQLTGARFVAKLDTPENVAAYEFARAGRKMLCLYALKDTASVSLKTSGDLRAVDLMGNPVALSSAGTLKLDTSPVFIETTGGVSISRYAPLTLKLQDSAYPLDRVPIVATITNDGATALQGTLRVHLDRDWTRDRNRMKLTVPPGGTVSMAVDASAKPTARLTDHVLSAQFSGTDGLGNHVNCAVLGGISLRPPWKAVLHPDWTSPAGGMAADLTDLSTFPLKAHVWWAAPLCPDGKASEGDAIFEPGKTRTVLAPDWYAQMARGVVPAPCQLRIETIEGTVTRVPFRLTLQKASKATPEALTQPPPWDDAIELDSNQFVRKYTDWRGPADLSAGLRFLWDETNLYVQVAVTDDKFYQPFSGGDTWQGDSVQFAVQPNFDRRPDAKYVEYNVALVDGKPEVFTAHDDFPTNEVTSRRNVVRYAHAEITRSGTLTIYRITIPWQTLGVSPQPGKPMAVSLLVNDNDGDGRRGWIEWGAGIGYSKDPSLYYDVTLAE